MSKYKQNRRNNLALGTEYEDQIVLYAFFKLKHNQELCREIDLVKKFDDLVLREYKNGKYEYSYYQLKHKDTDKNSEQSITWKNLLTSDKTDKNLNLRLYFSKCG